MPGMHAGDKLRAARQAPRTFVIAGCTRADEAVPLPIWQNRRFRGADLVATRVRGPPGGVRLDMPVDVAFGH